MKIDVNHTMDSIKEGTKEVAETAQFKTSEFHENYVSKVIPDLGKYGDAAKFVAEMAPGVSEYNAIREGDWQAFAIAAGLDVAAFAAGAVTAGAGYTAVKGGSTLAKAGAKKAVKEVAEAGTKKFAKEAAEAGAEKAAKEVAEAGTEKAAKELAEASAKKTAKELTEVVVEKAEKTVLKVGDIIDKTKFPEYLDEIEKITKREIPAPQKELLDHALKENDYFKLDKTAKEIALKEFKNLKAELIQQWEKNTGKTWPRYTEDVVNKAGIVIRRKGDLYDAHHIIELSTSGPNKWWNIIPASFPDEHQLGIHAPGKLASKIFG